MISRNSSEVPDKKTILENVVYCQEKGQLGSSIHTWDPNTREAATEKFPCVSGLAGLQQKESRIKVNCYLTQMLNYQTMCWSHDNAKIVSE